MLIVIQAYSSQEVLSEGKGASVAVIRFVIFGKIIRGVIAVVHVVMN